MQETQVWFLGWEDSLEKEMGTHSSILAWRIPWTEETGRLQSMGSPRVRHDLATTPPPPALITLPIRVNEANFLFASLSLFTRFSVEWPWGCHCSSLLLLWRTEDRLFAIGANSEKPEQRGGEKEVQVTWFYPLHQAVPQVSPKMAFFFSCYKEQQTISNQNSLNIYTSFYCLFNFIVFPDIASHSLRIFYSLLGVEIWSTFEQRLNLFNSYPSWCNSVPESLK